MCWPRFPRAQYPLGCGQAQGGIVRLFGLSGAEALPLLEDCGGPSQLTPCGLRTDSAYHLLVEPNARDAAADRPFELRLCLTDAEVLSPRGLGFPCFFQGPWACACPNPPLCDDGPGCTDADGYGRGYLCTDIIKTTILFAPWPVAAPYSSVLWVQARWLDLDAADPNAWTVPRGWLVWTPRLEGVPGGPVECSP